MHVLSADLVRVFLVAMTKKYKTIIKLTSLTYFKPTQITITNSLFDWFSYIICQTKDDMQIVLHIGSAHEKVGVTRVI